MRDLNDQRNVQAVIAIDGSEPEMAGMRAAVLRGGGSVLLPHGGMHALTVLIKASAADAHAQRPEVLSVVPNRQTLRTASTLETITGALTANLRSASTKTSYSGLDGSGVGIAVLDSGVMKVHSASLDGLNQPRVKRNVTLLNNALANDNHSMQDGNGHGTHVASVAAGRGRAYSTGAPDTTGIAPNANLYDVKVLSDSGRARSAMRGKASSG